MKSTGCCATRSARRCLIREWRRDGDDLQHRPHPNKKLPLPPFGGRGSGGGGAATLPRRRCISRIEKRRFLSIPPSPRGGGGGGGGGGSDSAAAATLHFAYRIATLS